MNQPTIINLTQPHTSPTPVDDAIREKMLAIAGADLDTPMTVQNVQVERPEDILQVTTFLIPDEETGLTTIVTHGVGSLASQTNVQSPVSEGKANFRAEYVLTVNSDETQQAQMLLAQVISFLETQKTVFTPGTVIGGLNVGNLNVGGFLFTEALTDGNPTHPVIITDPALFIFHLQVMPLRQTEIDSFNQEQAEGAVDVRTSLTAHGEKENAWSLTDRPELEWVRVSA